MKPRHTLARTVLVAALACTSACAWSADKLKELRIDYATYSPISLVVRKMGWMEEEFRKDGTVVKLVFSQGSGNAIDFLKKGSLDFASTGGLPAVLARVNGVPLKTVYVYAKAEHTALVVAKDSPITGMKDLKGKKIAATPGTDPYIFTLRALELHGLAKSDVELVALPHVLGRGALERKEVDAWAGLDPHMIASVLENGSRFIYRNVDFCSFGFVNTTEEFAAKNPEAVQRVVKVFEKARAWIIANPDGAASLVAEEAKVSLEVAKAQLKRNDFSNPVPGAEHVRGLKAGVKTLVSEKMVPSAAAADKAIDELVDAALIKAVKQP